MVSHTICSLIAAIDWGEPFIIVILTMHVLLLIIAVVLRRALQTQGDATAGIYDLYRCCNFRD
jgi:hypothetical protein